MVFLETILQQKHFILSWDPIKIDFGPVIGELPGVSVLAISENMSTLTLSSPGGLGTEESGGERLRFTLKPSDMSASILLPAPPSSLHVWYSFKRCLITPWACLLFSFLQKQRSPWGQDLLRFVFPDSSALNVPRKGLLNNKRNEGRISIIILTHITAYIQEMPVNKYSTSMDRLHTGRENPSDLLGPLELTSPMWRKYGVIPESAWLLHYIAVDMERVSESF